MTHKNFNEFKSVMIILIILMFFSEQLSTDDINQLLQDWYVMYKESKFYDPKEWGEFWFVDVNRDDHDFWIDPRGSMILYLHSR